MHLFKLIPLLVVGSLSISNAQADLLENLRDGKHVLLIRHADAPGYGDPPGYNLDRCSTQRNLGESGRKQALMIGNWLSAKGIEQATIFSSPWCRCLDTAKLLNKGPILTKPELGSFFDDMRLEKQQTVALEKLIQNTLQQSLGKPIILVTHHVNIQAYTGKIVNVGDMVLVTVGQNGKHVSHEVFPSPKL